MKKLELYYFQSCPYCQFVLNKVNELDLKVDYCDTMANPEYRSKLIEDTGRGTVPCLYIDGTPMHESSLIIKWLEDNANELEKR